MKLDIYLVGETLYKESKTLTQDIYQRIRKELFKHTDNKYRKILLSAVTELEKEEKEKKQNAKAKHNFDGVPDHIVCSKRI